MKTQKITRHDIARLNFSISQEANSVLSCGGSRLALIYALLFLTATASAAMLFAYLMIELFESFFFEIGELAVNIIVAVFIFIFTAPAFAGARTVAARAVDGQADPSELFVAFSSGERFISSYLGYLTIWVRYAIAYLILYIPDFVIGFFENGEEIDPLCYPIAFGAMLIAFGIWFLFTAMLGRLSYFIWSRRMPFFKALRESYRGHYITLGITGKNILSALLSVATLFILLIIQTGPLWLLEYEISVRKRDEFIEKLRKDGQNK